MDVVIDALDSPLGTLHLAARAGALCALAFADHWDQQRKDLEQRFGSAALRPGRVDPSLRQALVEYFAGALTAIDDVPVDVDGTAFQNKVWAALRQVPAGSTASYADIAAAIGQPTATRAVGMANHRNPVAIVVPCHRVINASGKLHGYGGGLARKHWLLEHERALSPLFRR